MYFIKYILVFPLRLSKFGTLLVEFSTNNGWVHGVKFSPSGVQLAWVSHDSSVNVVSMDNQTKVGKTFICPV